MLVRKLIQDINGVWRHVWVDPDKSGLDKDLTKTIAGNKEYKDFLVKCGDNSLVVDEIRKVFTQNYNIKTTKFGSNKGTNNWYSSISYPEIYDKYPSVPKETINAIYKPQYFSFDRILWKTLGNSKKYTKEVKDVMKIISTQKDLGFVFAYNSLKSGRPRENLKKLYKMYSNKELPDKTIKLAYKCYKAINKIPMIDKIRINTLLLASKKNISYGNIGKMLNINTFKEFTRVISGLGLLEGNTIENLSQQGLTLKTRVAPYDEYEAIKELWKKDKKFYNSTNYRKYNKNMELINVYEVEDPKILPEVPKGKPIKLSNGETVYTNKIIAYHGSPEIESILREGKLLQGKLSSGVSTGAISFSPNIEKCIEYGSGRPDKKIYVLQVELQLDENYGTNIKTDRGTKDMFIPATKDRLEEYSVASDNIKILKILEFKEKEIRKEKNRMKKTVLRKSIQDGKVVWDKIYLPEYDLSELIPKLYDNEYIARLSNLDYVNYLIKTKKRGTLSAEVKDNLSLWAENLMLQPIPFGSIDWNNPFHIGLAIIGCIGDLLKLYYKASKSEPTKDINRDLTAMLEMYENPKDRKYKSKDLTPLYIVAKSILRGDN